MHSYGISLLLLIIEKGQTELAMDWVPKTWVSSTRVPKIWVSSTRNMGFMFRGSMKKWVDMQDEQGLSSFFVKLLPYSIIFQKWSGDAAKL